MRLIVFLGVAAIAVTLALAALNNNNNNHENLSGSCESRTSCSLCIANSALDKCGWCADTNRCFHGAAGGPDLASCTDWRFGATAVCPPGPVFNPNTPCVTYDSCGECTGNPNCGWCASVQRCAKGISSGPSAGSCAEWIWDRSICPTPTPVPTATPRPGGGGGGGQCGNIDNCVDCARAWRDGCAWCDSNNQCMQGGPNTNRRDDCPNRNWVTRPRDCQAGGGP